MYTKAPLPTFFVSFLSSVTMDEDEAVSSMFHVGLTLCHLSVSFVLVAGFVCPPTAPKSSNDEISELSIADASSFNAIPELLPVLIELHDVKLSVFVDLMATLVSVADTVFAADDILSDDGAVGLRRSLYLCRNFVINSSSEHSQPEPVSLQQLILDT